MQIINLTKRQFEKLKPLNLSSRVLNTEAQMYFMMHKDKWHQTPSVLKKFYHDNGKVFGNKLYTINALLDAKDIIGIEELVMPDSLVSINNELVGYAMPYIPNYNLRELLEAHENDISLQTKVSYLKEVGIILEKMKKVREYTNVKDFFLNDIHENNFILNTKTNKINAVDLDSAKIGNNLAFPSKYLSYVGPHTYVSKYVLDENEIGGFYQVDENTEIYCYTIMILQFFYGDYMINMSVADFYVYLDYLAHIGVSKEIVDIFSNIFINKDNINPYEYLEELIPFYGRMNKKTFERVRNR